MSYDVRTYQYALHIRIKRLIGPSYMRKEKTNKMIIFFFMNIHHLHQYL